MTMQSTNPAIDLEVRTDLSDTGLDEILAGLPQMMARVVEGSRRGDVCTVRVFSDPGWARFAIEHQGYGTVLGEEVVGG